MADDSADELALVRKLKEQTQALDEEVRALKSGDGGGTYGGMDGRVSRLEQRTDKLANDVSEIKVGLATLTERVAHLPGKGFIITSVGTAATILAAIVLLADRLKHLFG